MSTVDPQEAREAADEILSRPEFQERPQSLLDRVLEWLLDRLGEVFSAFFGGGRGLIVGYIVLALAVVAAVYFVWRVLPRRGVSMSSAPVVIDREIRERRTRAEWLELAEAAVAERRWAEAVRARYHALTVGLAEAEELSVEPSTTSGEHRRRFAEVAAIAPNRRDRFEETVDRYEDIWFGEAEADATDVAAAERADDEVMPRT